MVFKKKEEVSYDKVETLIGAGTSFQGVITAQGTIRIDGTFSGEVETQADLVVGENGVVEAKVKARNVLVAGNFTGDLEAKGKMELTQTGRVLGDIKVKNLIIEEGALFRGNCQMETLQEKKAQVNTNEAAK